METVQLIQATLVGAHDRADKLLYLVQVDCARVQQLNAELDEKEALSMAIRTVQTLITSAFPENIVVWEAPVDFAAELPNYDPLYKMDGVSAWILPVVSKSESYFYLVG